MTLYNDVDDTLSPSNFSFIDHYVYGPGTRKKMNEVCWLVHVDDDARANM